MSEDYSVKEKIFKAFCDENRLRILDLLKTGEKCACTLLETLPIGQSTLSHHMKILVESGVVASKKEGKWTYYQFSESGSQTAMDLLKETLAVSEIQVSDRACCDEKITAVAGTR